METELLRLCSSGTLLQRFDTHCLGSGPPVSTADDPQSVVIAGCLPLRLSNGSPSILALSLRASRIGLWISSWTSVLTGIDLLVYFNENHHVPPSLSFSLFFHDRRRHPFQHQLPQQRSALPRKVRSTTPLWRRLMLAGIYRISAPKTASVQPSKCRRYIYTSMHYTDIFVLQTPSRSQTAPQAVRETRSSSIRN